jgi:membrane protein YqaA with SNARE-associated domain
VRDWEPAPAIAIPDDDRPRNHVSCALRQPRESARRLSESPKGLWMIGVLSFLESTLLPLAIEIVLLPYMLARRDILWRIAGVTLLGCLAGAALGYAVGYYLFASVGPWLLETMGWQQQFDATRAWFDSNGFWAVVAVGVTPVPFQLAMLAAGAMNYPIALFLLATVTARGLRYYGLAVLVKLFGQQAVHLWQRHKTTVSLVLLGLAVAVVVAKALFGGDGAG